MPIRNKKEMHASAYALINHRLTIRPGLAGTVPVLRPCSGVPAGWWKCPGFLFVCEDHSKIRKNTMAGVKNLFFFKEHLENHAS